MRLLLLPFLVTITSPLRCSSFAPCPSSINAPSSRLTTTSASCSPLLLHATAAEDEHNNGIAMERYNIKNHKTKAAALSVSLAAIMTLATPIIVAPHTANAEGITLPSSSLVSTISKLRGKDDVPSILLSNNNNNLNDDEIAIDVLTRETRADEKTAAKDARKARIEKSREAFFDYEARMAEETEDRIEAAEMKAEVEIQIDKKRIQALKEMELKAERDAAVAETPKEKAARLRKVKELERLEKAAERKERKAERAEKIFLAEEKQEKLILQQKEEAALKVSLGCFNLCLLVYCKQPLDI